MRIDIGNSMDPVSSPGLTPELMDSLDSKIRHIHDLIAPKINNRDFGYAALNPLNPEELKNFQDFMDQFSNFSNVLTIGIGGSALGSATLSRTLGLPGHMVLDNIDPSHISTTLSAIDFKNTLVNIVSLSGRTIETISNFFLVRDFMKKQNIDWESNTLVTTSSSGPLYELSKKHNLPLLPFPENIPGRFSVLSPVGLAPFAILGGSIEELIKGARSGFNSLSGSLYDSPAYAFGAVTTELSNMGISANSVMPYSENLETFTEWFAQLWSESLGKNSLGQIPTRAMGATDQHSQLQLYRAGKRNLMVTFIDILDHQTSLSIPSIESSDFNFLSNIRIDSLLKKELQTTEASLADVGCPSVRIELEKISPFHIGELLHGCMASCILSAELQEINGFDQPAVEWGKRALNGMLTGDQGIESQATQSKNQYWIGE
jgi:glucose-6-phosphate isomerase